MSTKKQLNLSASYSEAIFSIGKHFKRVISIKEKASEWVFPNEVRQLVFDVKTTEETVEATVWVMKREDKTYRSFHIFSKGETQMSAKITFEPQYINYYGDIENWRKFADKNIDICNRLNRGEKFYFMTDKEGFFTDDSFDPTFSFIVMEDTQELFPLPVFMSACQLNWAKILPEHYGQYHSVHEDIYTENFTFTTIVDEYLKKIFPSQFATSIEKQNDLDLVKLVEYDSRGYLVNDERFVYDIPGTWTSFTYWDGSEKVENDFIKKILTYKSSNTGTKIEVNYRFSIVVPNAHLEDFIRVFEYAKKLREYTVDQLDHMPENLEEIRTLAEWVTSDHGPEIWPLTSSNTNWSFEIQRWGLDMVFYANNRRTWFSNEQVLHGDRMRSTAIHLKMNGQPHHELWQIEDTQVFMQYARAIEQKSVAHYSIEGYRQSINLYQDPETEKTFSSWDKGKSAQAFFKSALVKGDRELFRQHFGITGSHFGKPIDELETWYAHRLPESIFS